MKLSAPKNITWIVALVIALLGLLGKLVEITFLTEYAFWFVLVAAVLLLLATWFEGL
jgi:hypothetical protein